MTHSPTGTIHYGGLAHRDGHDHGLNYAAQPGKVPNPGAHKDAHVYIVS